MAVLTFIHLVVQFVVCQLFSFELFFSYDIFFWIRKYILFNCYFRNKSFSLPRQSAKVQIDDGKNDRGVNADLKDVNKYPPNVNLANDYERETIQYVE